MHRIASLLLVTVLLHRYCRIKDFHVSSLGQLGQLAVVSKNHYKFQLSVRS